jgi:hypothetical protein
VFIGTVAGASVVVVPPAVVGAGDEDPPPEELDDPPPPQPAASRAKNAASANRATDVDLGFLFIDAGGIGRRVGTAERHPDASIRDTMMSSSEPR